MKRLFLISLLLVCVVATATYADDKKGNELQRKSELIDELNTTVNENSTYPAPFNITGQRYNQRQAAVSTGYYFYDSQETKIEKFGMKDIWYPTEEPVDTTVEPKYWHRIAPGPRIWDSTYWEDNQFGRFYFRNPADKLAGSLFDFRRDDLDSVDNAIAGPMPLGIRDGFYFNGIRYDSFYVSTNGVIALTNRRYIYNNDGEKEIPAGADHCYDINSMDWFVGGSTANYPNGTRARTESSAGDPSDGLGDIIADNFGYRYSVLGSNPTKTYQGEDAVNDPIYNPTAGIRNDMFKKQNINDVFDEAYETNLSKPALIAPFWTRIRMSQYNTDLEKPEDYSKVYFKYSQDGNKLIIAYYNISMNGQVQVPPTGDEYTLDPDSRPGDKGYFEWDAQVIFDRLDSSITFYYGDLRGVRDFLEADVPGIVEEDTINAPYPGDLLRANSICGVLGWARETNFSSKDPDQAVDPSHPNYPWATEYMQYTNYSARYLGEKGDFPFDSSSVKFKQWRNVVRAADIAFKVRNENTANNPNLNFTVNVDDGEYYELLAGEPLLGAIQPIATVQNMSNETQGPKGVNFIPQDYEFYAQFRFQNTTTGRVVYSKTIPISDDCFSVDGHLGCFPEEGASVQLINSLNSDYRLTGRTFMSSFDYNTRDYNGLPPYHFAQVTYPAFETNEFIDDQIGRMNASLITTPYKKGQDLWPFDDTLSTTLYVMRRLKVLSESASDYHTDINTNENIPSPLKWVAINADVVSGDMISQHPLPPRDTDKELTSPVIRMNRTRTAPDGSQVEDPNTEVTVRVPGHQYSTEYRGDEIRSYPIDLRQKYDAVVSFSVQRGDNYYDGGVTGQSRFRGDEMLYGPEAKVINNNGTTYQGLSPGTTDYPDMLVVEFARPSYDGVSGICNIPENNWRYHPQKRGSNEGPVTEWPAFALFGGGGTYVGFLEEDPNVALRPSGSGLTGFRGDIYDTGVDFEFKKYFVAIPDTFINWAGDGARNFRFRIRTLAKDNQINPNIPTEKDDYDDFFVDNIKVTFPANKTDISVTSTKIDWTYAYTPASQMTGIPVSVTLSNNTAKVAPVFNVVLRIYKEGDFDKDSLKAKPGKKPIYCRLESVANLQGASVIDFPMPAWNIRKHGEGKYTLVAMTQYPDGDLYPENDITYSEQYVGFAKSYQYESTYDPNNEGDNKGVNDTPLEVNDDPDVPELVGIGLRLPGYNRPTNITKEQQIGAGDGTDGTAGMFAVKFNVTNTDTIRGYNVFFGSINGAPDVVEMNIVKNEFNEATLQDMPSKESIPGAFCSHTRGWDFTTDPPTYKYDEYVVYPTEEPVELTAGTYWITLKQTAPDPIALGASADRAGMRITNYDGINNGTTGNTVYIDRTLRKSMILPDNTVEQVNGNYFCYMNGGTDQVDPVNMKDLFKLGTIQFQVVDQKLKDDLSISTASVIKNDQTELTYGLNNSNGWLSTDPISATVGGEVNLVTPVLSLPADNEADVSYNPVFIWSDVSGASAYLIEVADDQDFNSITYEAEINNTMYCNKSQADELSQNKRYYWRVKALDGAEESAWSSVRSFRTAFSPLDVQDERVHFTLQNRRYEGDLYKVDIYVAPYESWKVGNTEIEINYNTNALNAVAYSGYAVDELNNNLSGNGYTVRQRSIEKDDATVFLYPQTGWIPFTPISGNLAYPHTDIRGTNDQNPDDGRRTNTYFNGSWIPMFQPYFGFRESGQQADTYEECPEGVNPVELLGFKGNARYEGIELLWETASEISNEGFEIERRIEGNNEWSVIGFVNGHGTSSVKRYYNYFDTDVEDGNTYSYRLVQVDKDGTVTCDKSREITIAYDVNNLTTDAGGQVLLQQNKPNPFDYRTTIPYKLVEACEYKLEVLDIYGKVVKVIAEGNGHPGLYHADWFGNDEFGQSVAGGTYFYRLTAGDKVVTKKLTLMK